MTEAEQQATLTAAGFADVRLELRNHSLVLHSGVRAHGPDAKFETNYMGTTVGKWEGDTLVLDSIGFVDTTWIGRGGYFHSDKMHVIEKFQREGDAILYDVTLEDPDVLVEPLVFPTRIVRRNTGAGAGLIRERGNCETAFETEAAANQIRH